MTTAIHGSDAAAAPAPAAETIALCLSGGGLRATLFHFGLIKALANHSKGSCTALACVREIYSVSGGSITAAHLVANWADYNDPGRIGALQTTILAFAKRNVRDRVLRRWVLTRIVPAAAEALGRALPLRIGFAKWLEVRGVGTRRTHWLRKEYEHFLGTGSIADCYRGKPTAPDDATGIVAPPALYILATSFTSGDLCSFSRDRFEVEPNVADRNKTFGAANYPPPEPATPVTVEHEADGGQIPLAFAVTASSAFPPLFPPVRLTASMLRSPVDSYFEHGILLSDGGVFDNIGFEKFALVQARSAAPVSTLLVSNAGGSFKTNVTESYSNIISRNIRASDILMRRVGDTTAGAARALAALKRATGLKLVDIQIGDADRDDVLEPATQKSLRLVRTDLDAFEGKLARLLIDHGYRIAAKQLRAAGWHPVSVVASSIGQGSDEMFAAVAERAAKRTTWRSFFFGFSDFGWLLAIWLIILGALIGSGFLISRAYQTAQAQAAAQKSVEYQRAAEVRSLRARAAESTKQSASLYAASRALASGNVAEARQILNVDLERTERVATQANDAAAVVAATPTGAASNVAAPAALTYAIPKTQVPRNQQVFIQFAGALTRTQIAALNERLRAAGWRTQGKSGERIGLARNTNQVRYSGTNRPAAEELAAAINGTRIVNSQVRAVPFPQIGPNVLELWIALN